VSLEIEQHQIRARLLEIGKKLLPGESNVAALLQAASKATGIPYKRVSSIISDHLPTPQETGPFYLCPSCKEKKMVIIELCFGCSQSEGGKYKTLTQCIGCNEIKKFPLHLGELFNYLGIDFTLSKKSSLGVKLLTDNGIE